MAKAATVEARYLRINRRIRDLPPRQAPATALLPVVLDRALERRADTGSMRHGALGKLAL